ncbi:unnamed protein product [Didymodactylos carnosus]|uniref:F-box domain-containing protein n=1 Tax=Didymodactylos carnosus TaxID=1234261 RepID=A0A814XZN9_9BILA|nr:unnamed protein product [Didymodactylos carnosus]CAF3985756.1 unnamed protein product [Didymodactylos carnosus]
MSDYITTFEHLSDDVIMIVFEELDVYYLNQAFKYLNHRLNTILSDIRLRFYHLDISIVPQEHHNHYLTTILPNICNHLVRLKICRTDFQLDLTNYSFTHLKYLIQDMEYSIDDFYKLLSHLISIRSLTIDYICRANDDNGPSLNNLHYISLSNLHYLNLTIINLKFEDLSRILKQASNLRTLIIHGNIYDHKYLNSDIWKEFICNYLSQLKKFELTFQCTDYSRILEFRKKLIQDVYWLSKKDQFKVNIYPFFMLEHSTLRIH